MKVQHKERNFLPKYGLTQMRFIAMITSVVVRPCMRHSNGILTETWVIRDIVHLPLNHELNVWRVRPPHALEARLYKGLLPVLSSSIRHCLCRKCNWENFVCEPFLLNSGLSN